MFSFRQRWYTHGLGWSEWTEKYRGVPNPNLREVLEDLGASYSVTLKTATHEVDWSSG